MKTFFSAVVALVLCLISAIAFAAAPTNAEVAAAKAECDRLFAAETTSAKLAKRQCHLTIDVRVLEARASLAGTSDGKASTGETAAIKRELESQRKRLETLTKAIEMLATLAETKAAEPPKPVESAKPAPTPSAPAAAVPAGGAPYAVVEMPGMYGAYTKDMPELWSRTRVFGLLSKGENLFGYGSSVPMRVIVLKDGMPISVTNPIPACLNGTAPALRCGTPFYADADSDGKPDPLAYQGVDPRMVNEIFVPSEKGTLIELIYLTPIGNRQILVPGAPPQPFWGNPRKVRINRIPAAGKFNTFALSAI